MPTLALEIPMLALLGAAAVTFAATINSTLQLAVEPEMRGRVMALYSVVFLGSTPIGGPLAGWLSQAYDPRVALLLAGDHRPLRRLGGPHRFARIAPTGDGPAANTRTAAPSPAVPARLAGVAGFLRGTPRPPPPWRSAFRVRPGRRAPA